jgi:protein SCO1
MHRVAKKLLGNLLTIAITIALAAPVGAAPVWSGADPMRTILKGLVDQNGRPVNDGRFAGRYVLVNFIFTGCGTTCPTQVAELAQFERKLPPVIRNKLTILSISVDPGNDKPQRLKAYAKAFGVTSKSWTFATGRPDHVMRVVKTFAAMRPGKAGFDFHSTEVRLFDSRHRMIQRYSGAPLASQQIRNDLEALMEMSR